jgi:hypothetical protein
VNVGEFANSRNAMTESECESVSLNEQGKFLRISIHYKRDLKVVQ